MPAEMHSMAERGPKDPVFIVGLYKNGTTWLSSAFAAHPQFAVLRELDVVRSMIKTGWRVRLLSRRKRLANVFGRSGFCTLRAEQLAPGALHAHTFAKTKGSGARSLYDLPPEQAIQEIAAAALRGGTEWKGLALDQPLPSGRTLSFTDFPESILSTVFGTISEGVSPLVVMDGFLNAIAQAVPADRQLVLKGADQISSFSLLQNYRPNSPKIAIVRDGRDAAVSAFHYRRLMYEHRMASHHGYLSYWAPFVHGRKALTSAAVGILRLLGYGEDWRLARSMYVWRDRVRRVLHWANKGELYVLRYEDLLSDFDGTFSSLLRWLGADASPATVAAVAKACSFEAMTGRQRGVEGQHVIRRGISQEWRTALTSKEQELAWHIAGRELTALGYGEDGKLSGPVSWPIAAKAHSDLLR